MHTPTLAPKAFELGGWQAGPSPVAKEAHLHTRGGGEGRETETEDLDPWLGIWNETP